MKKMNVDICVTGAGYSGLSVAAGNAYIITQRIVISTSSRASIPQIEGIDKIQPLTNKIIFNLTKLPSHLIVIGGEPVDI